MNKVDYRDYIQFVSDYIYIPTCNINYEWCDDKEYDSPKDFLTSFFGENFYRVGDVKNLDTWRIDNTNNFFGLYAKSEDPISQDASNTVVNHSESFPVFKNSVKEKVIPHTTLNVIASCLLGRPVFGDIIATWYCDYGCGDWPEDEYGEPLTFDSRGTNTAVDALFEEIKNITPDKIKDMLEKFETYAFVSGACNKGLEKDEESMEGFSGWAFKYKDKKETRFYSGAYYPIDDNKEVMGDIKATLFAIDKAIDNKCDKITILYNNPIVEEWTKDTSPSSSKLHKDYCKVISRNRKKIDISFARIPVDMLDKNVEKMSKFACGCYVE